MRGFGGCCFKSTVAGGLGWLWIDVGGRLRWLWVIVCSGFFELRFSVVMDLLWGGCGSDAVVVVLLWIFFWVFSIWVLLLWVWLGFGMGFSWVVSWLWQWLCQNHNQNLV